MTINTCTNVQYIDKLMLNIITNLFQCIILQVSFKKKLLLHTSLILYTFIKIVHKGLLRLTTFIIFINYQDLY